jgi:hypothetical protein
MPAFSFCGARCSAGGRSPFRELSGDSEAFRKGRGRILVSFFVFDSLPCEVSVGKDGA